MIAGRIPGRTDNEIKNYWNTHLSKKLINQGIDPRTHKPLNPNPINYSPEIVHDDRSSISKPNPTPNYPMVEETGGAPLVTAIQSTDATYQLGQYQNQNLVVNDICNHQNWNSSDGVMGLQGGYVEENEEEDYIENCNELDTFSSFLDSLINDNIFVNQQQQPTFHPLLSSSSSAQTFNHATIWEAELRPTKHASNDEQSALNNMNHTA